MENVKIRKDLNDIVSKIKFEEVGRNSFKRVVCNVTLFTGKVLEFKDKDNIYDLFVSYVEAGKKDIVKSATLVEEERKGSTLSFDFEEDEEDVKSNTYICVLYELTNGRTYRLFPANKFVRQIIDNYYKKFKAEQKEKAAQAKQNNQTK